MERCQGGHDYFVADVAQVVAEGKVVVVALCKACGRLVTHEVFAVSTPKEMKEK